MLIKFETKSDSRVTGLSFHSERSWILASLLSGAIELWDYRIGARIHRFDGKHKGSVRSVHFHTSEPLFVSGGDDCTIKVWDHKLRRYLFTLFGHLDCVRTVQFHHSCPWILSASDDKMVRIWNWKSRFCISVLTGHNHCVTCASFHPRKDLVLSASMDQTVQVWDIASLSKKSVSQADNSPLLSQVNSYFLAEVDAVRKYVLQGHDQGVNWASFHHSLPLIVSGANDNQVKIWQIDDTKAWEVDSLQEHLHGVSCVLFHAQRDIIVSNSEDKTVQVWHATKKTCLQTLCREYDKFWILASHPKINLFGAGHDSGMIVFKLERERPAFAVIRDSLLYVKDQFLHLFDYLTLNDIQLVPICKSDSNSLNQGCRTLSYEPVAKAVLICSSMDMDFYELYILNADICIRGSTIQKVMRGVGASAVLVGQNRLAVLQKSSNQVLVKNLRNDTVKKSALPIATDVIHYAGTGKLLCGAEDRVVIFDLQKQVVLGDLRTSFIRYVVWSSDMERVALLGKHSIVIANKELVPCCELHEKTHVKSGTWDDGGVFVYTTLTHIKYCLPDGDSGIIKSLDVPLYITKIYGNTVFCLDRDGKIIPMLIDSTEYVFKLSLIRKRYDLVESMIKNPELDRQAMIAYLQQKNFQHIALHIVKDKCTRFKLALESGNIQEAAASAKEIHDKDHWCSLGVQALCQGNIGLAEYAYQSSKDLKRLSFLYLITGNLGKLSNMMKIAQVKNEVIGQFQYSLYLGAIEERVKILQNSGNLPLAYIAASLHGLHDAAENLTRKLGDHIPSLPEGKLASLLMPPKPILRGGDWPVLVITGEISDGMGACEEYKEASVWSEALDMAEVPLDNGNHKTASIEFSSEDFLPSCGTPPSQIWVHDSSHPSEHAAAGNFDTAMCLLNERYGMRNFSHLKSFFIDLHLGSQTYLLAFSSAPAISMAIDRRWTESSSAVEPAPALVFHINELREKFKHGLKLFTVENLSDALHRFLVMLRKIPLVMAESERDVYDLAIYVVMLKEYILALKMQLEMRELKDNLVRRLELAAYSTHFDFLCVDLKRDMLLNSMTLFYEAGNQRTAANFARRLLQTKPSADNQVGAANQVLQASEENMRDVWKLKYDFASPFKLCGATFMPIYEGHKDVTCPYCKANFLLSQEGQLCTICDLAVVGAPASGIFLFPSRFAITSPSFAPFTIFL